MITREEWIAAGHPEDRYDLYEVALYIADKMGWSLAGLPIKGWAPGASFYVLPDYKGFVQLPSDEVVYKFRDSLKALEFRPFDVLLNRYPFEQGGRINPGEGELAFQLIAKHFPNLHPYSLLTSNRINRAIELEYKLRITPAIPISPHYEYYGYSGDDDLFEEAT